jgi:hypothetical protein
MSLQEIVDKASGFATWPQTEKIKFFGWYFHVHEGITRFSTAQLRDCYRQLFLEVPESFAPFFKPLENRKPKELLRDGKGYHLGKQVIDALTDRFGGPAATAPVSRLLAALPSRLSDSAERAFIEEAILCIKAGASRAAIVLGWCAVVDRMRRKVEAVGFDQFNTVSAQLKAETKGRFKNWNKGVQANSPSELLAVFDGDLMVVLEGMGLLDDNQAQRLRVLFQYRNHSAHPADTPIGPAHVVSFFTDAVDLVLANKKFDIPP